MDRTNVPRRLGDAAPAEPPRLPKAAVTCVFVGTVLSETVASNRGIGDAMMSASSNVNVPLAFAGLFILAGLGVALHAVFSLGEGQVTGWATCKPEIAV